MTRSCPVVAIVSSIGGLKATSSVLTALPSTFGAAVIVLRHLQPDRQSLLPQLLAAQTALPARAVTDGTLLTPGVVFVAPAGQHTLITRDRRMALVESGDFPPSRPSADLLLTTLAMACGPDAIAVILTGGGNDGATGATVVHSQGGLVLAADEATSEQFGMPSAAIGRPDVVDFVLPLSQIGPALVALVAERSAISGTSA